MGRNDALNKFQRVGFQEPSPMLVQHGTIYSRLNTLCRHMLKNQQANQVGWKHLDPGTTNDKFQAVRV
jgi:hypothetical protein